MGEILDGAVTTIRRNLGTTLGLSALVAVVSQLLTTAAILLALGDRVTQPDFGITPGNEAEQLEDLASGIPGLVIAFLIGEVAAVFLTGVLTVVVGQAVLGRQLGIAQAWQESRGRLPRLLGLTLLYIVIWLSPFIAALVLTIALSFAGEDAAVAAVVVGILVAIPVAAWLYIRYALSLPALMLESVDRDGQSRPVGVIQSLHRSAALVKRSWWRVWAILTLIWIINFIVMNVLAVPFGLPTLFGGGYTGDDTVAWYILNALSSIIAATITAPFSAAATALLYVDRRIRREGLDIELARAAGVQLPGQASARP